MVTKYSGSGYGPIRATEENMASIAARRERISNMRTQGVMRGATFTERGISQNVGPVRPDYAWARRNTGQQLIGRDEGTRMGMGWQARMAANNKILEGRNQLALAGATGRNQLANTMLTGRNQIATANAAGVNQRANTLLENQGTANVQDIKNRGSMAETQSILRSREGIAERSLAQEVRDAEQKRYDDFMAKATSLDQANPMTPAEADKAFRYQTNVQEAGPRAADRTRASEEVVEAGRVLPNMTPQQRAQYIATLSPAAQAHFASIQEDQNARARFQQQRTSRLPLSQRLQSNSLIQGVRQFVNRYR